MKIFFDEHPVDCKQFVFPGGEVQVRLGARPADYHIIKIRADIRSSNDFMALLLVTDAVRRVLRSNVPIYLECPYLPYARQDRVCHPGEALSLHMICAVLDSMGYAQITTWDVHNPKAVEFSYTPWKNVPASVFIERVPSSRETAYTRVAPDHGAVERTCDAQYWLGGQMFTASKVRDPDTGAITGMSIDMPDQGAKDIIMIDDICDGGRTFIELAKLLRHKTTGRVLLYVTHGIFSQGFGVFEGLIDHIYVANPFPATLPAFVTKL